MRRKKKVLKEKEKRANRQLLHGRDQSENGKCSSPKPLGDEGQSYSKETEGNTIMKCDSVARKNTTSRRPKNNGRSLCKDHSAGWRDIGLSGRAVLEKEKKSFVLLKERASGGASHPRHRLGDRKALQCHEGEVPLPRGLRPEHIYHRSGVNRRLKREGGCLRIPTGGSGDRTTIWSQHQRIQ